MSRKISQSGRHNLVRVAAGENPPENRKSPAQLSPGTRQNELLKRHINNRHADRGVKGPRPEARGEVLRQS